MVIPCTTSSLTNAARDRCADRRAAISRSTAATTSGPRLCRRQRKTSFARHARWSGSSRPASGVSSTALAFPTHLCPGSPIQRIIRTGRAPCCTSIRTSTSSCGRPGTSPRTPTGQQPWTITSTTPGSTISHRGMRRTVSPKNSRRWSSRNSASRTPTHSRQRNRCCARASDQPFLSATKRFRSATTTRKSSTPSRRIRRSSRARAVQS